MLIFREILRRGIGPCHNLADALQPRGNAGITHLSLSRGLWAGAGLGGRVGLWHLQLWQGWRRAGCRGRAQNQTITILFGRNGKRATAGGQLRQHFTIQFWWLCAEIAVISGQIAEIF